MSTSASAGTETEMPRTAMPTTRTEMDAETALLDAEYLAELLEKTQKPTTRLFARSLTHLARSLRLAIVADCDPEAVLRLHHRLETTMRLAYTEVLATDAESEPASQRPTIPYPMDFPAQDHAENDTDREAVTVRHPRPTSEVRRRVSLPTPPLAPRKPLGWVKALRR